MLLDEVRKAQQVFNEEFTGEDPKESYKDDFIKLLDLPRHSSMEDVYNYIRDLVEETKKLTDTIISHGI